MVNTNKADRFFRFVLKQPVLHFLFYYLVWEFIYILTGLPVNLPSLTSNWDHFFFDYGLLGTINFLLFYLMAFYVIPKLFVQQKKNLLLLLICIASAILFTILKYEIEYWNSQIQIEKMRVAIMQKQPVPSVQVGPLSFWSYFGIYIWFSFIIIIIAFAYQLALSWYKNEKVRKELENQKLQAELSFLKMQINPHFLFNALNNIYSMAVLEKSKRTGDNIMKLSELLRYMLYEKEDSQYKVSLDKEINHINSFIDLQKLRHNGDTYIQFSIEGDTMGKKVPPLLLFPLIENSFKHGILQDAAKPISIQLNITSNQINFSIFNFKNNYLKDHTGGIGLSNVRKRLALLYPNEHVFNITETDHDFLVELQLPL
ncbi:MAG: histidine kinase [Ginsengibacter sp.]